MKHIKLFEEFEEFKKPNFLQRAFKSAKKLVGIESKEDRATLEKIYRTISTNTKRDVNPFDPTISDYNEMLSYSGGDVTRMPIIGKVITKPIGPFESGEYDIVEVIESEKGPIYVANMWYKEWKRIPQLIHSELVDEYIPVSNESFDMNKSVCDRCGGSTNGITTMSMFNEDVICMSCKEQEKKDPEYGAASKAEIEAVRRGERNYKGAIPDYKPLN
jgi:hypothetical protein